LPHQQQHAERILRRRRTLRRGAPQQRQRFVEIARGAACEERDAEIRERRAIA
jgi:hypothetical protein